MAAAGQAPDGVTMMDILDARRLSHRELIAKHVICGFIYAYDLDENRSKRLVALMSQTEDGLIMPTANVPVQPFMSPTRPEISRCLMKKIRKQLGMDRVDEFVDHGRIKYTDIRVLVVRRLGTISLYYIMGIYLHVENLDSLVGREELGYRKISFTFDNLRSLFEGEEMSKPMKEQILIAVRVAGLLRTTQIFELMNAIPE